MFILRNTSSFTNFHFFSTMGRVKPQGQCARSIPLQTWLRPTAFKKKKNYCLCVRVKRCRSQRTTHERVDPRLLWPRSRDFERRFGLTPAMVEFRAGEFFRSSIYITEGDDPAGKGHPIPVFLKVIYLYFPIYLTFFFFITVVIEALHRMCSIHFVLRSKREKR